MAVSLPFLSKGGRRTKMISVDLGSRTTKAVLLERRGETLALLGYALLDTPIFEKKISPELLAEHLRAVARALGKATKNTTLTVGLDDALVRQVELPQIPVDEMRQVLKINHKNYLQQDLPNHVFACHIVPPRLDKNAGTGNSSPVPKLKVLTAVAKQQLVNDLLLGIKNAGLTAKSLVPVSIAPVNTFELVHPEIFEKETVALVDIGFKHTSVCIMNQGELALNRIVNIGGDTLTDWLAKAMNISHAEAEGIKVGMAPEVEVTLQMQVAPLGREIRASLDFFETQQDRPVSQIFISGGSARSEMIRQMLHAELMLECKTWNPISFLQLALSGTQSVEIEQIGPQLTVAVGAALAAF